jgi:hypothetical protein
VDAVRKITGVPDALIPVSNDGKGPDALVAEVSRRRGGAQGPVVIFTDLQSRGAARWRRASSVATRRTGVWSSA